MRAAQQRLTVFGQLWRLINQTAAQRFIPRSNTRTIAYLLHYLTRSTVLPDHITLQLQQLRLPSSLRPWQRGMQHLLACGLVWVDGGWVAILAKTNAATLSQGLETQDCFAAYSCNKRTAQSSPFSRSRCSSRLLRSIARFRPSRLMS